jgi:hypothetical protein
LLVEIRFYLFLKAPVSHPPLSQFNRTFHKTNAITLNTGSPRTLKFRGDPLICDMKCGVLTSVLNVSGKNWANWQLVTDELVEFEK